MFGTRRRLVVAVATAALALSACTSAPTNSAPTRTAGGTPTSTQGGNPTSTQESAGIQSATPGADSKEAWGDVKLGAITADATLESPMATVTITNHATKRSNYIVDLIITTADGQTKLDATMVSAEGLNPGQTVKREAQFMTTQKLPTDAKLTIVGVARLAA